MAQSSLYINSAYNYIDVESYSEEISPILKEKAVVVNPYAYAGGNTVLYANGFNRHIFTITGYCTNTIKGTLITALLSNTKIYPTILPDGTLSVLAYGSWYYLLAASGEYLPNDDNWHFKLTFKYGGV